MERYESKRDGDEINTGGGASVGGNVDSGRDFTGRDSAGNVINQYFDESRPRRRSTVRRDLTVAEASVLWEAINRLSETVGGLRSSIDASNRETSRIATTLEERERQNAERERQSAQQYKIMSDAITTIQGGLAELGLTPPSQREPKWKTDLLVWSTAVIAVAAVIGLSYLLFGGS